MCTIRDTNIRHNCRMNGADSKRSGHVFPVIIEQPFCCRSEWCKLHVLNETLHQALQYPNQFKSANHTLDIKLPLLGNSSSSMKQ
jgi:hypothetical protein